MWPDAPIQPIVAEIQTTQTVFATKSYINSAMPYDAVSLRTFFKLTATGGKHADFGKITFAITWHDSVFCLGVVSGLDVESCASSCTNGQTRHR